MELPRQKKQFLFTIYLIECTYELLQLSSFSIELHRKFNRHHQHHKYLGKPSLTIINTP